ncbi:unnamed protein product [Rotaria sp. Silwood1]|nr:unnamed protein product [Rotaria sp. Silwood1]CAF1658440.1 unnamed protein product [Rotaria sp. Silwood1]CAF3837730.1 unnamed protein product [Rotaria sp. Silwood1]CAF3886607.1 unnamed protein product [Rotaria sp. Silwood1]CAF3951536.1 unnamed protein product [Rotaria sp. Silwood1]
MRDYTEFHSIARLSGAPSSKVYFCHASLFSLISFLFGYVGFEQGGQLTEAIGQQPYAIENGPIVDFTNTIFILTSTIGVQYILEEVANSSSIRKMFDVNDVRSLKRYLDKHITTELAKLLIQMKLSPHSHVTVITVAQNQYQIHIEQLQRTN